MVTENDKQTQPSSHAVATEGDEQTLVKNKSVTVERERDQTELEATETLLQLQSTDIDTEPEENEEILPVDALKQDDFTIDMADAEAKNTEATTEYNKDKDDNDDEAGMDDDATVIYELEPQIANKSLPVRGRVTFKHYGIRRHSPRLANLRKHRCHFCDKSLNSKKELNDHHRAEHTGV